MIFNILNEYKKIHTKQEFKKNELPLKGNIFY